MTARSSSRMSAINVSRGGRMMHSHSPMLPGNGRRNEPGPDPGPHDVLRCPAARMTTDAQPRIGPTFGALMLVLIASLDQTIVSTALPTIAGDLGGGRTWRWS